MSVVITAAAILEKAGADHVLPLTHPKALSGHRCSKHLKYGATADRKFHSSTAGSGQSAAIRTKCFTQNVK